MTSLTSSKDFSWRNIHPNGTGIGLTLVRVIARLHNAEIMVDSIPNAGTTFTVSIPTPANLLYRLTDCRSGRSPILALPPFTRSI